MGRAAIAFGATDRRPGVLDRSRREVLQGRGSSSDPPLGPPRACPVLSRVAEGPRPAPPPDGPPAVPDVGLHAIWFQLPLPDRQRFGHRFSGMVLKALGLRSCPTEGGEA
jgi:hypothetical protein